MKKLPIVLFVFLISVFSYDLIAQGPPPPPGEHGVPANQDAGGGGAPIGGGLFILLGLGAAYGGKKIYDLRKESKDK